MLHKMSYLVTKWHVRPAKIQISLGIRPVWSKFSLWAQWVAKDPSFLHADSEDSGQTGRMPRLIWVFAGLTLTLLVLSRGGSILVLHKIRSVLRPCIVSTLCVIYAKYLCTSVCLMIKWRTDVCLIGQSWVF